MIDKEKLCGALPNPHFGLTSTSLTLIMGWEDPHMWKVMVEIELADHNNLQNHLPLLGEGRRFGVAIMLVTLHILLYHTKPIHLDNTDLGSTKQQTTCLIDFHWARQVRWRNLRLHSIFASTFVTDCKQGYVWDARLSFIIVILKSAYYTTENIFIQRQCCRIICLELKWRCDDIKLPFQAYSFTEKDQ